ncbi:MAG: peptide chain release factor N(5)-glutamine methyltransferase [Gemmatimonadaceae bacterium]
MANVGRRTSASVVGTSQSVGHLVEEVASRLAGCAEPTREARDLIAALLDVPRHWPLLRENKWVDSDTWQRACAAADRRAKGAPLAYAVGRANFRGLTLDVDERVLIPRPETELLVDLVLQRCRFPVGGTAVDVGTGSGAIAIALATEGTFERVIATDISLDALEVARGNAEKCRASVEFIGGNLLTAFDVRGSRFQAGRQASNVERQTSNVVAIVSNPPYISFEEIRDLPPSVRDWEPAVALLSSHDGMATTAQLVRQAAARLEAGGLLALEIDARRASLVAELVSSNGWYQDVSVQLDLAGRERFVLATRRGRRGSKND